MRRLLQLALLLALLAWCAPASAQVTYVGAGAIDGDTLTTDSIAPLPAGTQTNDILLVYCWVRSTTNTTTVTGYTEIDQVDTGTGDHRLFWKRHDGSEGSATCDKDTSADSYARQYAFRGVVTSGNPWNAISDFVADTGTGDPTSFTGVTTGADSSMVVSFDAYEDNDGSVAAVTSTDPSAYTEDYAENANGADGSIEVAYATRTSAGATGNISINYGTIASRSDDMANIILSLDPASIPNGGRIQCWGTNETAASSTTITLSLSGVQGGTGHLLHAMARGGNASATTITMSDGTNGSWTMIGSTIQGDPGNNARTGYFLSPASGTYTLTATFSPANANRALGVCEYTGMDTSSVYDTTASGTVPEGSGDTSVTTGTFSTSVADETLSLWATQASVSAVFGNGTIAGTSSIAPYAVGDDMANWTLIVSATQSGQTATATTDASVGWVAIIDTFKITTGGAPAVTPKLTLLGVGP